MDGEIKIEIFEIDSDEDENQQAIEVNNEQKCVKSDPDRDYLLIVPAQQQKEIKIEELKGDDEAKKDKNVECKICNRKLASAFTLRNHMKSIHLNEFKKDCNFHCDLCEMPFKLKQFLVNHMQVKHIEKKQFECDFDGKIFENKQKLREHMMIHSSNVKCKICLREMKASSVRSHMQLIHPSSSSKFQCQLCLKDFKTKACLQIHIKIHDKKFQCKICDKKYGLKYQLKSHMATHDDLLKFECKVCDKKFKYKISMQKHLKIQHGNLSKSFKCLQCIYATYSIHLLRIHSKIHDKDRLKSLKCSKCDYATDIKYRLSQHMKTHDDARVKHIKCNWCDFATDNQHELRRHTKFHEKHDEKVKKWKNPIKCEKCWMFWRDEKLLYLHMKNVHVDTKFQCDLCGNSIKAKQRIARHFRNVHKIKI